MSVHIAKAGTQVIVPYRDEDTKRHLKVMGDLGQVVPMVRSEAKFSLPRLILKSPYRNGTSGDQTKLQSA